jgi:ribosome-binding factor A
VATKRRTFRLAEQIREMIAWQLQKAADPRFNMVTVTSVVLSPDMRNAKVYWVVSGGNKNIPDVDEAFESAEGLFKRALAKDLKLRFIPSIKFYYDDTFDVTDNVGRLLSRVKNEFSVDSETNSESDKGNE